MNFNRQHIVQSLSLLVIQSAALLVFSWNMPGLAIQSFWAGLSMVILISVVESLVWWVFIEFFAKLPILLYPLLTFFLTGLGIFLAGNLLPGVAITGILPSIWIAVFLTVINAILGGLFSLDEDSYFDAHITKNMVKKYGHPEKSTKPGFLFLEIDGLSIDVLKEALEKNTMPFLKSLLTKNSHTLIPWETDFSSQTGAMQAGILEGNNANIPAYRWWDRKLGKTIMSGNPFDAEKIEALVSSGKGLLSKDGASRGNMFSGDAGESLFTISSIVNKKRHMGPGFYVYLVNPYVIARLITRFLLEIGKEWYQAYAQKVRKDKYIVTSRNPAYAFLRAFIGPFLQDLTTYAVIGDILRGVPEVYALYAGYDDLGHFAGPKSPEAFEKLTETDRYFARIAKSLEYAPRPYHLVFLSDHGQSMGPTFESSHGVSLKKLVSDLTSEDVFAQLNTNEAWDNLNAVLSESTKGDTKTAKLAKKTLFSKIRDGAVQLGPDRDLTQVTADKELEKDAKVIVYGSGCTGLIYIKTAKKRLTYDEIQDHYPHLIAGLVNHPGVGFIVVKDAKTKAKVLSSSKNPLKVYGKEALTHIIRENSFDDAPDIIVHTKLDPESDELCGFENQVGHHGGLGGPQSRPFILYPKDLTYDKKPILGAPSVFKLFKSWL